MKKLLAIAVAVAFAAPAMADTSVYGKAHVSVNKASGTSLDMQSHSSRIGLKGSNALDNGLTATHKFEMGINLTDAAGAALTSRDTWVGLKGGFGEVRFGRHTAPTDLYDDHADFMTNGHKLDSSPGRVNNVMAYLGSFGPVSVAAAHLANGAASATAVDRAAVLAGTATAAQIESVTNKANDIALGYKAGPINATLGYTKAKGISAGNRVALSYSGANYGVGFVHEKGIGGGVGSKANTISGKYSFGKAYVAAEYGKVKGTSVKSRIFEVGYGLGKGTKTYFEYSKPVDAAGVSTKNTRIGLVHNF